MVGNIYFGLLNIIAASLLYKTQNQNLSQHQVQQEHSTVNQKKKYKRKSNNCCQKEVGNLLRDLSRKNYKIKIFFSTGPTCCKMEGLIRDIRKKGSLLLLINPETNAQWYIPVDKIAAIYPLCC